MLPQTTIVKVEVIGMKKNNNPNKQQKGKNEFQSNQQPNMLEEFGLEQNFNEMQAQNQKQKNQQLAKQNNNNI